MELLIEILVIRILYSQHYGSLIHCFADARNKRKIKLPPLETLQSRINSREFTSSSGAAAAAAFSVEDACRHFHGLKVNVGVKGGERRKARRVGVGRGGRALEQEQSTEEKDVRGWRYMRCLHLRCRLLLY